MGSRRTLGFLILCMLAATSCGQQEQATLPGPAKDVTATLNPNTASFEQLSSIPALTDRLARAIISFRKKVQFRRVEDLLAVPGIGEKTFLKIRPYFSVSTLGNSGQ